MPPFRVFSNIFGGNNSITMRNGHTTENMGKSSAASVDTLCGPGNGGTSPGGGGARGSDRGRLGLREGVIPLAVTPTGMPQLRGTKVPMQPVPP